MKDDLQKRMKENYEVRTRTFLPRRTYTLIRIDGKAFHTFTKKYMKPFDESLINIMNETAKFLCENIQGAVCAYVQSDEISILLTDFDKPETCAWFDGNVQKITSVSSSFATGKFNQLTTHFLLTRKAEMGITNYSQEGAWDFLLEKPLAFFDSRVYTIPDPVEVENYFVWRQKDAVRNSISMVAQSLYSHNELKGKSSKQQQEMIFQKGQNWNDYDPGQKRGRMIIKVTESASDPNKAARSKWTIIPAFDFLKERNSLTMLIPKYK